MAESYQIYLNSKYADTQNNDTYKFQLNTLDVQEGYYIYLSVQNVSIPYSFYNINESNNKIEYIIFTQLYTVTIPPSNYNINQFIEYLSSVMTDFKITYSSKTNKITFVNNMINFTFLLSSTSRAHPKKTPAKTIRPPPSQKFFSMIFSDPQKLSGV